MRQFRKKTPKTLQNLRKSCKIYNNWRNMYIASQILVFIGLVIDLIGRCLKNKNQVLSFNIIAYIFYLTSYLFLHSWLGAIASLINFTRNILYINFDKKQKPYYFYLSTISLSVAVFVVALCLLWTNPLDLFLLASIIISTIGFSFKNVLLTRITLLLNSSLWAVYNFSIKGYVNMACDLVGVIIVLTSLIIYHIIPKINAKKVKLHTSSSLNDDNKLSENDEK